AAPDAAGPATLARNPINTWTDAQGHGAVIALDPETGERKWTFPMYDLTDGGILTTASDVLFTGNREGFFHALDARTGALLWKSNLGGAVMSAPGTYSGDGERHVIVNSCNVVAPAGLGESARGSVGYVAPHAQ